VDYICGDLINIADDYDDWFELGCSLASGLGEEGREYFHDISAISGKYKPSDCDKKYNECLKADRTNIGKFFNMCKKYNVK
ncbi:MAG: PriCT-2 domain-containing protein, partial [Prevotella sp.]|nr:PriCT-2 domain-containing protein [Prevotella sp.]